MKRPESPTLIASYEIPDIKISTQWIGSGYETLIKHPLVNHGRLMVVDKYGTDIKKAQDGHNKWLNRLCDLTEDFSKSVDNYQLHMKSVKITLSALMKIMKEYSGIDLPIIINANTKNTNQWFIYIKDGKYAGSCIYDFVKMEAWSISPLWTNILSETKAEIIDRQEDSEGETKETQEEAEYADLCVPGYDI